MSVQMEAKLFFLHQRGKSIEFLAGRMDFTDL